MSLHANQLTALAPDVWECTTPLIVGGLHIGSRTLIVRLPDGSLWVHSPGPLDSESLTAELGALGPVSALVAPNLLHHLFIDQWVTRFPDAKLYGPPGLSAKLARSGRGVHVDAELSSSPPPAWSGCIDPFPLLGQPKVCEFIFYHRPSKTLMLTDAAFHLEKSAHWWTRNFMKLNGAYGKFTPSRMFGAMVKDREALRRSLAALTALDINLITVAHGANISEDAPARLRGAFARYL